MSQKSVFSTSTTSRWVVKQERTDKLVAIFNEFIFSLSYFF
ncbi:Uncharacterised protein [Vibrio cholerae]|uniref:Uncharacterized protein n=1 Tax=Vibrio cholerae TaxID=666 RepID=A0A655Z0U4_VIBCL|nr:Uncharacterised protein [Vibrio cholerae]CSA30414.1 Uncharacterised protein [Vibrio cholerae]CSB97856.1 Uncharacterised protein [Vibrio cholerae]CSC55004.1 Uncharacterised protein [Vibrio cholerae]